jgi:hypothetical protein
MDPVTLVEGALAAGGLLAAKDTTTLAVSDAYAAVKAGAKRLFAGNARAELILKEHELAPQIWVQPLMAELAAAEIDDGLVAAAQALMKLIDPAGSQTGKYSIINSSIEGSQFGDNNVQHNSAVTVFQMAPQARVDSNNIDIHIDRS